MENSESLFPVNQLPESYYEVKVEGGNLAPFVPPIATEQQKTVEELKQVVVDLTALVQQLLKK